MGRHNLINILKHYNNDCINNTFQLYMEFFNSKIDRNIEICKIRFGVHSYNELKTIINHISTIDGVDEVRRLDNEEDFFGYNDL